MFSFALLTLLLPLLCGATSQPIKIDVKANPRDKRNAPEVEVFTPIRVASQKEDVTSFNHFRSRRSLDEDLSGEFENPTYKLTAFGEDLHVRLTPDDILVAPGFTTTYEYSNTTSLHPQLRRCFYKGTVLAKPGSQAVFSICDGLTGSIHTDDFLYSIRPSEKDSQEENRPHIIERRSINGGQAGHDHGPQCGVRDSRHVKRYEKTFLNSDMEETVSKIVKQVQMTQSAQPAHQNIIDFEITNGAKSRQKRDFKSRQHYIETLVVADSSMLREHGDDLEHYILSIMMVANRVFSHPSLGSAMALSVVKIMIVDERRSNLRISRSAARTLNDFCAWQKKHNILDDSHPQHADLAILLTRKDLCGDSCDTLGMAEVGTMCSSLHSCAIVQDDGLSAAYTVAHEVGHVLNMMHDDNGLCTANFADIDPTTHIMSSTMTQVDSKQPWSSCSKQAVLDYLQDGRGRCLLDRPTKPKVYPRRLPGELYDVNVQCEMAFGKGSVECPYMSECGRLWCQIPTSRRPESCHTRNYPRADGTRCGAGKQCLQGKCVFPSRMRQVDGNWGSWSAYGSCSRSCGGGIHMASRQCNNPVPENGGKYCMGNRIIFKSCNIHKCPPVNGREPGDFREEQCSAFNGQEIPLLGARSSYTWVPKYSDVAANDRCKLICQSVQTGAYITLHDRVVDGTRCGPDTTDLCVHGRCLPAGCDGVLGSKAKYNKCGVCNGNKASCRRVRGKYNHRRLGYNDVVTFPVGAASIKVIQKGRRTTDGVYLALVNGKGEYILNGALTLSTIKLDIPVNGTTMEYSGATVATEIIHSHMPLKEPITLQVLSLDQKSAPKIRYRYYLTRPKKGKKYQRSSRVVTVTKKKATKKPKAEPRWVAAPWKKCKPYAKQKCGSGWKTRVVRCRSGLKGKRPAQGCDASKKPFKRLPCFVSDCPVQSPRRQRPAAPVQQHSYGAPSVVNRGQHNFGEGADWFVGRWGQCSTSCGLGTKMRQVKCQLRTGQLVGDGNCDLGRKPSTARGCKIGECP